MPRCDDGGQRLRQAPDPVCDRSNDVEEANGTGAAVGGLVLPDASTGERLPRA